MITRLYLLLLVLCLLLAGCKRVECRHEWIWTGDVPNISLTNGQAGGEYILVEVCK
jgi:hypothetical protein